MTDRELYKKYLDDSIRELRETSSLMKEVIVELKTKQDLYEKLTDRRYKSISICLSALAVVLSLATIWK